MGDTYSVYKHTNKINGKVYIGMTSTSPEKRWGKDGNGYRGQVFGRAIQKYGWDNFEHEILINNLSKEDANELEKSFIKLYNATNPNFGYNISEGGVNNSDIFFKKIYQYSFDGKFICEYKSADDVNEKNPLFKKSAIQDCCCKPINTVGYGYRWSYEFLGNQIEWDLLVSATFKPIYCYDLDGNFVAKYLSSVDAGNKTGIDRSGIAKCCKGIRYSMGGYRWFYEYQGETIDKTDYKIDVTGRKQKIRTDYHTLLKPVYQYSIDGIFVGEYSSADEVYDKLGFSVSATRNAACNETRANGYYWSHRKCENILKEELL